ncbi:lipocalin-like [Ambystoma mexicanum]|uniref:lipocalin-like n=1 Tax=Ambystoma mexicanum TaxID=8296 RepID=UPI0037E9098F
MPTLALTLGLLALCALHAHAEVSVQPDFQDDKILGKWYSIGLASNSKWFQSKKHVLTMCSTVIAPAADGSLVVTSTYPKSNDCEQKSMTFFKTEQPGRFRATSARWSSEHDIIITETNYVEYALVLNRKTKGTEVSTMVTLYGREKNLRPELVQKFQQFSLEQGLPQSSILILPHTDRCINEA